MSAQGQPYATWYTRDVLAGEIDEDPPDVMAKLTSIREAVKRVLLDPGNDGDLLEAIMAEIARRL